MLRKMVLLAGGLALAGATAGEAQERPGAKSATVMAKLEVLEAVAAGGRTVVEAGGGIVTVSSELDIAGRVPVVMAAHVLPAPVKDRWTARREARRVEREARLAVESVERTKSGGWVSRSTLQLEEGRKGYRVVWYVAVAL